MQATGIENRGSGGGTVNLLEGKVGIVSGSTRGIGRAIARGMMEEGATIWVTGRDSARMRDTLQEFSGQFGDRVRAFRGDLAETGAIRDLIRHVMDDQGKLDLVVANIGSGKSAMGWDVDDAVWTDSFRINFFAGVHLAREALRVMIPRKKGSIVFISSIAGCETIAAPVPYAAAKAALLAYMKYTAAQVAAEGIRMNAVSPGNILFPDGTWDRKKREKPANVEQYICKQVPMQRFGTPEEIASLVCFLSSEKSQFITGANMVIDGGQTRSI